MTVVQEVPTSPTRARDAILGELVTLRPVREDDLEQLRAWYNDPANFPYMGRLYPLTEEDQYRWFLSTLGNDDVRAYAVEDRSTNELIGSLTLRKLSQPARCGEIGILMGHPSSGFGSDAIRTLLQYAFVELRLNCVSLEVRGDNTRAITCYMRAGFRPEGVLRRRLFKDGVLWDLYSMSILPEEFFDRAGAK